MACGPIWTNRLFVVSRLPHSSTMLNTIWDISLALRERFKLEINYLKPGDKGPVARTVEPCGLIFSEYYFYLIAYDESRGYDYPLVFRLDRIQSYQIKAQHFRIPETNRFEEGEFRKRVQFMRAGSLINYVSFLGSILGSSNGPHAYSESNRTGR